MHVHGEDTPQRRAPVCHQQAESPAQEGSPCGLAVGVQSSDPGTMQADAKLPDPPRSAHWLADEQAGVPHSRYPANARCIHSRRRHANRGGPASGRCPAQKPVFMRQRQAFPAPEAGLCEAQRRCPSRRTHGMRRLSAHPPNLARRPYAGWRSCQPSIPRALTSRASWTSRRPVCRSSSATSGNHPPASSSCDRTRSSIRPSPGRPRSPCRPRPCPCRRRIPPQRPSLALGPPFALSCGLHLCSS